MYPSPLTFVNLMGLAWSAWEAAGKRLHAARLTGITVPQSIKRPGLAYMLLFTLCYVASGCATIPTSKTTDAYLIGVRYDMEPLYVGARAEAVSRLVARDLARIKELGFDAVVFQQLEPGDRLAVLNAASEADLVALIPDIARQHRVRCALSIDSASGWLDVPDHPALGGVVVGPCRARTAVGSCGAAVAESRKQANRVWGLGEADGCAGGAGMLALLTPTTEERAGVAVTVSSWLGQFHACLAGGMTSGLVIDRFRRLPGDPGALGNEELTGSTLRHAVQTLLTRARAWGPMLRGCVARPLVAARTGANEISMTLLSHGARRYVLLCNPSSEDYTRQAVRLPGTMGDRAVSRAVEVPPSTDRGPGQVIDAAGGVLTVPIALRPGDAALFEIF